MTTTTTELTTSYTTICTVGYTGSVSRYDENRAAHGSVCHIQARKTADGRILARRVNTNGRHTEVGEAFAATADDIAHWSSIAAR